MITYPGGVSWPPRPAPGSRAPAGAQHPQGPLPDQPRQVASVRRRARCGRVHAAVLAPGRGPRRYLASGTFLRFADLVAGFAAVTGRRLPTITVPARMLLPVARAVQLVQHVTPVHIPVEFEGAYFCRCATRFDDTTTRQRAGCYPTRPRGDAGRLGPVAGRARPHLPQASRPARQRLMCARMRPQPGPRRMTGAGPPELILKS